MRPIARLLPALLAAALSATPAAALTYDVNLTLDDFVYDHDTATNTTGSDIVTVTGQIVTDGTLGALTEANFLSWNFTIGDSNSTLSISSTGLLGDPDAGGLDLFTATMTELVVANIGDWFFDNDNLISIEPFDRQSAFLFGGSGQVRSGDGVIEDGTGVSGSWAISESLYSGNDPDSTFTIGTVTPVPLPAAAPLLGAAMAFFAWAGLVRRRSSRIARKVVLA